MRDTARADDFKRADPFRSLAVNLIPRAPHSAHFVCISYHIRGSFNSNVSALRSGLHRVFRHHKWDFNPKGVYMFSSKGTANAAGNIDTSLHEKWSGKFMSLQITPGLEEVRINNK